MAGNAFSFSYSKLTRFENCEYQYDQVHVSKAVKDEDSEASKEGQQCHAAMRARVIDGTQLPPNLRHMEAVAARFAAAPGRKWGEMKLAIDHDFQPCAWFARNTFVRVVIDLLIIQGDTGIVIDWKFGKRKEDFTQMGLNAAVLAKCMPELQLFKTALVWAEGLPLPKNYTLSKLDEVWGNILPRVQKMRDAEESGQFRKMRSGLCRGWCPVKHCEFNQDR